MSEFQNDVHDVASWKFFYKTFMGNKYVRVLNYSVFFFDYVVMAEITTISISHGV